MPHSVVQIAKDSARLRSYRRGWVYCDGRFHKLQKVALKPENRIIKLVWRDEDEPKRTGGSMMKNIGLWIDHKKAIIVVQSEKGEDIQQIESGVGRHVRYRGAPHPRSPYSAQYQQGDDQLDNRFTEQLNKFYDKVIVHIRAAEALLIFGPGEAKGEFEKRIAHEKVHVPIVGIETVDKMTDRQIVTKVRRYFKEIKVIS